MLFFSVFPRLSYRSNNHLLESCLSSNTDRFLIQPLHLSGWKLPVIASALNFFSLIQDENWFFFLKIVSEMPMKRTSTLNLYLTSDSFHAHKAQCSGNEHPAQQQDASKPRSKFDRKAKLGKCPVPRQGCPGRPVSGRNAEITGFRTEAGRGKCWAFDLPPPNLSLIHIWRCRRRG